MRLSSRRTIISGAVFALAATVVVAMVLVKSDTEPLYCSGPDRVVVHPEHGELILGDSGPAGPDGCDLDPPSHVRYIDLDCTIHGPGIPQGSKFPNAIDPAKCYLGATTMDA